MSHRRELILAFTFGSLLAAVFVIGYVLNLEVILIAFLPVYFFGIIAFATFVNWTRSERCARRKRARAERRRAAGRAVGAH